MLHARRSFFTRLFCLLAATTPSVALVDNGTSLTLHGIPYYAGGIPVSRLEPASNLSLASAATDASDLFPLAVVHTNISNFGLSDLEHAIRDFTARDDVFQGRFLQALFLDYTGTGTFQSDLTSGGIESTGHGNKLLMTKRANASAATVATLSKKLANGPYFVSARTGHVYMAYRLYPDDNLAFTQPSISDQQGVHLPLVAVTENLMTRSIAVPSRLYYTATEEQPLAGLRLGVKDIFHVRGLKTSGGNRAYYYLYPERNVTAPAVQRLLDQGAVLVGKTGTVQFANGDRPTADWVDVHCPFNPRGDGYQDPSGSSSGSGAAIGAYEWLDLAVGSDTGGSMRGPAGVQGVYGNRPSTGAVTLDHVIPLSPHLDTAGVFARSASLWSKATHAWYQNFTDDYSAYPREVYYSKGTSTESDPATALVESFVDRLQGFLDGNNTTVNVTERWATTAPSNITNSLSELLSDTYAVLTSVDQFKLLGQQLFDDYGAENDGRRPFINPGPLVRWQWGQNHSSEYDAAVHNATIFNSWWSTSGFGRTSNESCSQGIYVYPSQLGKQAYRNTYLDAPEQPPIGWSETRISGYGKGAELVVPVGEVPYNSTVTLQEEYLPVAVNLLVAHGCDLVLANLARDLEEAGILRPSKTGTRI